MSHLLTRRLEAANAAASVPVQALQMQALEQQFGQISPAHLLAMTGAGFLGRVVGLGALNLFANARLSRLATSNIFHVSSLFSEVGAYRLLTKDEGMFDAKGFLNDFLSFGLLRIAGHCGGNTNPIQFQMIQSGSLVFGQSIGAELGLMEKAEGSLGQQLVSATIFGMQQQAGIFFMHQLSGHALLRMERHLQSTIQSRQAMPIQRESTLAFSSQKSSLTRGSSELEDTRHILNFFNRTRLKRIETARQRIELESNSVKKQCLEEEVARLSSSQFEDLNVMFAFITDLNTFYVRNMRKVGVEGFQWHKTLERDLIELQISLGAYDLFLQQDATGNFFFRNFCRDSLPTFQRWARPEKAPAVVRQFGSNGAFGLEEWLYVNLHQVHSFQDVVGDGKMAELRASFDKTGELELALQVSQHSRMGILGLSDGNHRARALLDAGYDFAWAKYKGKLYSREEPVLIQDLRVVSMQELARLIQERRGDNDVTFFDNLEKLRIKF